MSRPISKLSFLFLAICSLFAGIGATGFLAYRALRWFGFKEYRAIQAEIDSIPGARLLHSGYNDEGIGIEDIIVVVNVENKGILSVCGVGSDSYSFGIDRIGAYEIQVEGYGYFGAWKTATGEPVKTRVQYGTMSIGHGKSFAHLFPFEVNSISDVITNYDKIVEVIEKWPVSPKKAHMVNADGNEYWYSIVKLRKPYNCLVRDPNCKDVNCWYCERDLVAPR